MFGCERENYEDFEVAGVVGLSDFLRFLVIGLNTFVEMKYIEVNDEIIDSRDPMAVIEPLWLSVDIYGSKELYEMGLEPFSNDQRAVFAAMWFISEVFNGGFYQFYTNATGIVWEDAMNGFETLGIPETRSIIQESCNRFEPRPSFDREEREGFLDVVDVEFEDLDERIYLLDEKNNLTEKIAHYICNHRESFYFKGEVEN